MASAHTGIEFVAAAHPHQVAPGHVVACHEVVVPRQPVHGADPDLVQPREEVLAHVNGLLEGVCSNVRHACGGAGIGMHGGEVSCGCKVLISKVFYYAWITK